MRHESELTSTPPTNGPRIEVAADAPAQTPNARPCSSPWKLAVMIASEPGTRSAPAAPCRMRGSDQELHRRREAAEQRGHGERDQADREHRLRP